MTAPPVVPLQTLGDRFGQLVDGLAARLPETLFALVVLLLGVLLAYFVGERVRQLSERLGIGEAVASTALGEAVDAEGVDLLVGYLVLGYIVLLSALLATSIAGFPVLNRIAAGLFSYAPQLVAAVLVLLAGAVVAEFAGRVVRGSTVTDGFAPLFAAVVKALVYVVAVTIALDTAGVSTTIVETFAASLAQGLALAIALALGLAFGLGGKEYVAANIDDWADSTDAATEANNRESGDGAEQPADGDGESGDDDATDDDTAAGEQRDDT